VIFVWRYLFSNLIYIWPRNMLTKRQEYSEFVVTPLKSIETMPIRKLAEAAFVIVMVAVVPVLSYRTARSPEIFALPRTKLYSSAVISQWLLAVLGMAVFFLTSMSLSDVGLRPVSLRPFIVWTALPTVISLAALAIVVCLESIGWWPREPELVNALIPRTRLEKMWAVLLVAPTAAVCEELLYRGILLAELSRWFHCAALECAISSSAFGLAHLYQGFNGVVRAALLGALLAAPVIRLGSLYPSMASHFLIDVVALVWLGPKMLKKSIQ
jgi:membrane protease YdiL (CAAX protease family)